LKGLKEVLSDSELKDVTGGVTQQRFMKSYDDGAGGGSGKLCDGKKIGDPCTFVNANGHTKNGTCEAAFPYGIICNARDYTCC
jgi:hypothetical protein